MLYLCGMKSETSHKKVLDILPKFVQWEGIEYASDFICPECGGSAIQGRDAYFNVTLEKPMLVGWCETNNGFMAVFECPCCHSRYRFHPQISHFDKDNLDFYLGAYVIDDSWISNADELEVKLKS